MRVIVFLLLLLVSAPTYADTYAQLITQLRERVGEPVESTSVFSDRQAWRWLHQAQYKVATLRGLVRMSTALVFDEDALYYDLPSGMREINGVLAKVDDVYWKAVANNPLFRVDTTILQYTIDWHGVDDPYLYLKDPMSELVDGDSLRVFYRGVPNDTISDTSTYTDECGLPDDEEHWVVDEAILMYFQYLRMYDIRGALWQQTRQDQGLVSGEPTRE